MYLWKVHKFDFGVWVIACLGTMFLGVEIGLSIAICVSLLLVTYESAYPHTAVLGRLPGTTVYRNVKQYPEAERYDGIVMVRIDAPIYFANTQNVREKLIKYEMLAERQMGSPKDTMISPSSPGPVSVTPTSNSGIKYVILEMSPVSHVDTSALHILHDMLEDYRNRGVQLCLVNPSAGVMEILVSDGFAEAVGRENIYVTMHDAIDSCLHEMDSMAMTIEDGHANDTSNSNGIVGEQKDVSGGGKNGEDVELKVA